MWRHAADSDATELDNAAIGWDQAGDSAGE
jgi:hypothetical protein